MSEDGRTFARPGSSARAAAAAIAWLWRLGPVLSEPDPAAVGFGTLDEQDELQPLVEAGRLAGLVLFAPEPGPPAGAVPARRPSAGVARFEHGALRWEFTVFDGGTPAVRSSLGTHAVRDGHTLGLAVDPETAWTELRGFWTIPALASFLAERLERPLVLLPPVGAIRLDDVPGTAQHQAQGRAKPDWRTRLRVERLRRLYAFAGARLNVAVCARALVDGGDVPLERVWPRSVAALARGVADGAFEPVCHGYLHLDVDQLEQGRVEYREFRELNEAEAGRRLDASIAWQSELLGEAPRTFVAPAWAYSDGTLAAAAARGLPAWLPPALAPALDGGNPHESIGNGYRGLHRVDYRPLVTLAAHGLPPTPVLHGALLDQRVTQLKQTVDPVALARLALQRDIVRLPQLRGVRWTGAGELVELLRAHDRISVRGREVELDRADEALLLDSRGLRRARVA